MEQQHAHKTLTTIFLGTYQLQMANHQKTTHLQCGMDIYLQPRYQYQYNISDPADITSFRTSTNTGLTFAHILSQNSMDR